MKKILSFLFLGLMFVSCAQQDNLSVAVEMMKNKQYDSAIEMFNKIASQTNDKDIKSNALYNIGLCYGLKEDYEKEIEYYKKAIEEYSSCQPALYELGMIYYKDKDLDNSLKVFEQLVEVNPEHEGAYYMVGVVQNDLGNKEDAIISLQKAFDLGMTDAAELLNKIK
jgi:tetratricopeptide (TPR) repeat protein